jgi:hypothetical protein
MESPMAQTIRLLAVLLVGVLLHAAISGTEPQPMRPELKVAIAAPASVIDRRSNTNPRYIGVDRDGARFHVVVTNVSRDPQRLWTTLNSWGYYNVRFEVIDKNGTLLHTIRKKPVSWSENTPGCYDIQPGEHAVFEVEFTSDVWDLTFLAGEKPGEHRVRMRAVYEIHPSRESEKYKVWTGAIASDANDYVLNNE